MTQAFTDADAISLRAQWPSVKGEYETVERLLAGASISRYGDGEFKMIDGFGYVREKPNGALGREMLSILRDPPENLIVGIPTMDKRGPKYGNWIRRAARMLRHLNPSVQYYSSFISRGDSAPWIETIEYSRMIERLWKGRHIAVVSERTNKFLTAARGSAGNVTHIECPSAGAYAQIDRLTAAVRTVRPDIVFLCCGPTATCMAARLARKRVHAIDIGSIGGMLVERLAA